jgi:nucleoside permease NupC
VAILVGPTIIFVAAVRHLTTRVMQIIVRLFAVVMHRVMRASGAESPNGPRASSWADGSAVDDPAAPSETQSELMTV